MANKSKELIDEGYVPFKLYDTACKKYIKSDKTGASTIVNKDGEVILEGIIEFFYSIENAGMISFITNDNRYCVIDKDNNIVFDIKQKDIMSENCIYNFIKSDDMLKYFLSLEKSVFEKNENFILESLKVLKIIIKEKAYVQNNTIDLIEKEINSKYYSIIEKINKENKKLVDRAIDTLRPNDELGVN